MGIYDRNYYREEQSSQFFSVSRSGSGRSVVMTLIIINVAVFIVDAFTERTPMSTVGAFCEFLSLHDTDAVQPWFWFRILTAAFSHASVQHIFGNMIMLFFFGRPIEQLYGSGRFLWMYLTAAMGANLVWLVVEAFSPGFGTLLGASGAVAAVFILFCIHFPHQKIYLLFFPFFGIPAWIMGVIFIGGDLLGQLGVTTGGAEAGTRVAFLVHLVGAGYGYLFYRTRWSLDHLVPFTSSGSIAAALKPKPKLRIHQPDSNRESQQLEEQADKILQKLHEQGESSLTRRERKILEDYSRSIKERR